MVDALAGQRHGGTRTNGWGTGEARNSAKGESFRWMSLEELAMRTVPSKIGEDGSQLPDLAFISVGPRALLLCFSSRSCPGQTGAEASGRICDWIMMTPGPNICLVIELTRLGAES